MTAPKRSEAIVVLLLELMRRGRLSTAEASALLGREDTQGRRSTRRLLQRLCAIGPIRVMGEQRDRVYVLDPLDGVERVTDMDRIALRIGRDAVSFLEGTLLAEGLAKAASARGAGRPLPDLDRKFRHLSEPEPHYERWQDVIDEIVDGLARARSLDLAYEARSGERHYPAFQPLTLCIYRRALYLLGRVPGRARTYRLRVDRIARATVGEAFDYPDDWDPDAELAPWFGMVARGEVEPVILRFAPEVAGLVRARRWHPTARLHDLPDGGVQLQMETGGDELVRFVLEWGETCEVLAPAWLRERVVAALSAALARYRPEGSGPDAAR